MIHKRLLPPLGNRIVKTAAAVFICLIIYMLRGYEGGVAQSCISAVICIQPHLSDSKKFALDRIKSTIHGSLFGFFYLLLMSLVPELHKSMLLAYFIMSFCVLLAIYSTVLLKRTDTAVLVIVVFLGSVISYPDVSSPLLQTFHTLVDTAIGTLVAIGVNMVQLPREKHPEYLFFIRTMDLVPDRYTHIPSSVHITLDHLYKDGAKLCLVSRWAPAFIISQMGLLNVNAPVIIMDGAALYDTKENKYLEVVDIPHENVERLKDIILGFGACFNLYTVYGHSMCIYHYGELSEAERREYEIMKRSPYRNYLNGGYREEDKVVFLRVIDTPERIDQLSYLIESVLPPGMFRVVVRGEAQFPELMGLYFYAPDSSVARMKQKVLDYAEREFNMQMKPCDILPRSSRYLPEHDALLLLSRVKNIYEPVKIFKKRRR